MVDKLEVRIPGRASFTREFSQLYRDVGGDPKVFRGSRLYLKVGDLREFDYPMLLHLYSFHGTCNHKVELIETGGMTYDGMLHEIERVFALPAATGEIMRLDLAADVQGIPVSWFHDRVRVRFKQFACEIGQYSQMGREIQTLYFGKRPNCFRVYDKLAEHRYQYRKVLQKVSPDADPPAFQELYGYPERGCTLTRVERQMAGGRVPEQFQTVGDLPKALSFDPFEPMEFVAAGQAEPNPDAYKPVTWLAGMGMRHMIERDGFQQARAFINHRGRNWNKLSKTLADFFPAAEGITRDALLDSFRGSLWRQFRK